MIGLWKGKFRILKLILFFDFDILCLCCEWYRCVFEYYNIVLDYSIGISNYLIEMSGWLEICN